MSDQDLKPLGAGPNDEETEISVNEYGDTKDSAVVVDEPDRTVLLTRDETIVIEKEPSIDVVPKNRPRKVYGGMWGQAEIATVGLGIFAILATVLVYFFLVVPSNRELEANRAERDRLERELTSARSKYGSITSTETQVSKILASVEDFELNYLPAASTGRNALYQRLNGLIAAYGLLNTSGPDYAPLETADQTKSNQSDEERGRGKFRSLFPGVYVTMTVEGSYPGLRRFIKEIETGQQFVVISAVQLLPSDNEQPRAPAALPRNQIAGTQLGQPNMMQPGGPIAVDNQPRPPQGKTHGETVSLRLEMAAYFRRPNFVPAAAQ